MYLFHVLVSALVVLLNFTVVSPKGEVNGLTMQQQQAWKDVNCTGITVEDLVQMTMKLPQENMDWESGLRKGFSFSFFCGFSQEQICREVRGYVGSLGTMLTPTVIGVQYDDQKIPRGIWMKKQHTLSKMCAGVNFGNANSGYRRKAKLVFINVFLSAAKALRNFHVHFPNMVHLGANLWCFQSTKSRKSILESPAKEFDAQIFRFEFSQTLEELMTRDTSERRDPVLYNHAGWRRPRTFMSPEARNGGEITQSSDVFSLGAQLRSFCDPGLKTGWNGKEELWAGIPNEFDRLRPICSEGLRDIIYKCLGTICHVDGKPRERYKNAQALVVDLRALLLKEAKLHALVEGVRALLRDEATNQKIVNELHALLNGERIPERVNEEAHALVEDVRALLQDEAKNQKIVDELRALLKEAKRVTAAAA